jgi:hypothetical protein
MPFEKNGTHEVSRRPSAPVTPSSTTNPHRSDRSAHTDPRRRVAWTILLTIALVAAIAGPSSAVANAADDYILMPRSELLKLPTSGTAWANLKEVANTALGDADLCDQDEDHHLRTLAAALLYARTGNGTYATKARAGVMNAIKTQVVGCHNAVLSLGRQLAGYVFAADFAGLSGSEDTTFRTWLSGIRTKNIGGHSAWYTLVRTHKDAPNNWGAHAGASRLAASLYLGDSTDTAAAIKVTRGFLGDRTAYAGFRTNLDSDDWSWSCAGATAYTPVNKACTKSGINVDGGIIADISRGGSLRWPPPDTGISYHVDSIAAVAIQIELAYRHGQSTAWSWSSSALKRAANLVQRSARDGGDGWNLTTASSQIPWLLNKRYGSFLPTRHQPMGRGIGFTDWLYGGGTASAPAPAATTPAPVMKSANLVFGVTTTVPTDNTVRAKVKWSLQSTSNGVKRYELQVKRDAGSYRTLDLSSPTATSRWVTLAAGADYTFRVRAVDRSGRVGAWRAVGPRTVYRVADTASRVSYSSGWKTASSTSYIGGKVHYTKTAGAKVSIRFDGTSIAWTGPTGPTRGKVKVYLDGTLIKTVDLYSSTFDARKTVFAMQVGPGVHKLTLKALGTSGRPTVALDQFQIMIPG